MEAEAPVSESVSPTKVKRKRFWADGKNWPSKYGSRRQVFNGSAYMTKGRLRQGDIMYNKQNRLVSAKKSRMASKEQRLLKHGYGAKKGKFGYVRVPVGSSPTALGRMRGTRRSRSRKSRPRKSRKSKSRKSRPRKSKSRKSRKSRSRK